MPNGPAQERVIREALDRAGVLPAQVDYLEAHGTGTELGDPIEVRAAGRVYGEGRETGRPLLLGAVKTNVGHLEAAAGVAGAVKVLLALRHGRIPPHLHFETPNPRIEWEELPVRVVSEAAPWPVAEDRPPRAGVSSFGLSGTNAHLILEGYDEERHPEERRPVSRWGPSDRHRPPAADETPHAARTHRVLPLSARSDAALSELAARHLRFLTEDTPLADAAWTAGVGRKHFPCRAGLVFREVADLRERLRLLAANGVDREASGSAGAGVGKVAFLFPGEGVQWAGMGRDLYASEPRFREVLDRCDAVGAGGARGVAARRHVPGAGGVPRNRAVVLDRTEWTQPALFALSAALTPTVARGGSGSTGRGAGGTEPGNSAPCGRRARWGSKKPRSFAARCGSLMGSLPAGGGMAAVFAPLAAVEAEIGRTNARVSNTGLSVAAENGTHVVVSGPRRLVGSLQRRLAKRGVRTERLPTRYASHSELLDPVLDELERAAEELGWNAPEVPVVSSVTGREVGPEDVLDAGHWRRQARSPVRFAPGVGALARLGVGLLIEVGPRPEFAPLAAGCWPASDPVSPTGPSGAASGAPAVVASLGPETGFVEAVASAWEAGAEVSFAGLFAGERRCRVSLPTYPFQRERYWVETASRRRPAAGHPLLGVRRDARDGEVSFETELFATDPGWMSDHRVLGEVVAPGALYAAQGLAAFGERVADGGAGGGLLGDVQIHRPLVVSEEVGRTVQVVLDGEGGFEVVSRKRGDEVWDLHAAGAVRAGAEDGERVEVEGLTSGLTPTPAADFYRRTGERGIVLGPSFRVIEELWCSETEAVGALALPEALSEEGLGLHPVLLDGCFQVLGGVSALEVEDGAWLPFGWEALWISGSLPARMFCRARVRSGSDEGSGELRQADLDFYAPSGESLGGVRGFTLKRAERSAFLGLGVDDLLYEMEWRSGGPAGLLGAGFLRGPEAVAAGVGSPEEHLRSEGIEGSALAALGEELERESRHFALAALDELGWTREPGDRFEGEDFGAG